MEHEPRLSFGDWFSAIISFFVMAAAFWFLLCLAFVGAMGGAFSPLSLCVAGCTVPVLAMLLAGLNSALYLRSRLRKKRRKLEAAWAAESKVCAVCGYNLTGNVSGRCSECGVEIPPRDQPAES